MTHGVDNSIVREKLRDWGFWLRSARSPNQSYTISRLDTPLSKKKTIKPIYRSESAENLDMIMSFHMNREAIDILDMYYAKKLPNVSSAAVLKCSVRTFTAKRYQAEAVLEGILSVINSHQIVKSA